MVLVACLTYFGKSAKDINLAEVAMTAGYSSTELLWSIINPELTEQRRNKFYT